MADLKTLQCGMNYVMERNRDDNNTLVIWSPPPKPNHQCVKFLEHHLWILSVLLSELWEGKDFHVQRTVLKGNQERLVSSCILIVITRWGLYIISKFCLIWDPLMICLALKLLSKKRDDLLYFKIAIEQGGEKLYLRSFKNSNTHLSVKFDYYCQGLNHYLSTNFLKTKIYLIFSLLFWKSNNFTLFKVWKVVFFSLRFDFFQTTTFQRHLQEDR